MTPSQELNLLLGMILLIFGLVLYVQDKVTEDGRSLYYFVLGKIGLRKPHSEIDEKWYHWDYLWGHLSWVLGRRALTFWWQRRTRGFDDSELWSLDDTIIRFILPRLKAFRNSNHGYPGGIASDFGIPEDEEGHAGMSVWLQTIDKMIHSMEMWERTGGMPEVGDWDTYSGVYNREEGEANYRKYQEGMDLFHIYFHGLWD